MPPPKFLLRSTLSTRQCTSVNPTDCESSSLLSSSSSSSLPSIAIILIAIASLIGLLLLIAYIRCAAHTPKQHHTGLPPNHSPYRPHSPPSPQPPTASFPNARGSRRQPQSSKAKKSKFIDPPPAYALENLSEAVLERAPGLMVVPTPREGEERGLAGGEELLAPLQRRERERDSAPAYSIDETVYRQEGPTVTEAQSGVVVTLKDVSRSEAEAGAGAGG